MKDERSGSPDAFTIGIEREWATDAMLAAARRLRRADDAHAVASGRAARRAAARELDAARQGALVAARTLARVYE